MSDYPSPFGSLSDGSQLLGDSGGGPTPPPRRTWVPVVIVAAVAVVALVVVGGAALLLLSGGDDSSDEPAARVSPQPPGTEDHSDERTVAPSPTPEAPVEPSAPAERPSVLSPKGSAAALAALRKAAAGREAITLRIDPDGMTAIVKGKLLLYRDGELQTFPGPSTSTPIKFSLDDVDEAAPARINAAIKEKGKQIEYLVYVVNPTQKTVTWIVVTKDGKNYSADPTGRRICKLAFQC